MKVLVIGGGEAGIWVIKQLKKKDNHIILADAREEPPAVVEGLVPRVDIVSTVTPINLDYFVEEYSPELIVVALTQEDLALDRVASGDLLTTQMIEELTEISSVPVIVASREFI